MNGADALDVTLLGRIQSFGGSKAPLKGGSGMKCRTVLSAGLVAFVGAGCVPRQSLEDPPERPDIVDSNSTGQSLRNGGDLAMALSAEPDKLDPATSRWWQISRIKLS